MRIEFIGCTSAGKSTLAGRVLRACRDQGIDAWMGYDFVLRQVRLDWITGRLPRGLLVNLIALLAGLAAWPKNRAFYQLALRVIARLPPDVAWHEKLYIGRDVLKNIGIYEIVGRRAAAGQIVLLDEGPLHTAHYLFVNVAAEPNAGDVADFGRLVPRPDVVVYVTHSEDVLIERTIERGHKRIPDRSYASARRFIRQAIATFDELGRQLERDGCVIVVDSQRNSIVGPGAGGDPRLERALQLVGAGIGAVGSEQNPRITRIDTAKESPLSAYEARVIE